MIENSHIVHIFLFIYSRPFSFPATGIFPGIPVGHSSAPDPGDSARRRQGTPCPRNRYDRGISTKFAGQCPTRWTPTTTTTIIITRLYIYILFFNRHRDETQIDQREISRRRDRLRDAVYIYYVCLGGGENRNRPTAFTSRRCTPRVLAR